MSLPPFESCSTLSGARRSSGFGDLSLSSPAWGHSVMAFPILTSLKSEETLDGSAGCFGGLCSASWANKGIGMSAAVRMITAAKHPAARRNLDLRFNMIFMVPRSRRTGARHAAVGDDREGRCSVDLSAVYVPA